MSAQFNPRETRATARYSEPNQGLLREGDRQAVNAGDTLQQEELQRIMDRLDQLNHKYNVTNGPVPGTVVFNYPGLRPTPPMRISLEAATLAQQSGQFNFNANLAGLVPEPATTPTTSPTMSPSDMLMGLTEAGRSGALITRAQAEAFLQQVQASGQRAELLLEDGNMGHVGITGVGFRAGVRLSPEALELMQNSQLVQSLNQPAAAQTPPTSTPTPATDQPASTPEPLDSAAVDRLRNGISDARSNADHAATVEAFLAANPVVLDGQTVSNDGRAGFASDGRLSEEETTAALNRIEAMRWSSDPEQVARVAALDRALNAAGPTGQQLQQSGVSQPETQAQAQPTDPAQPTTGVQMSELAPAIQAGLPSTGSPYGSQIAMA